MKTVLIALGMVSLLAVGGCQTAKEAKNLATLSVDFSWSSKHGCSSTPPAFKISGIPEGTKTLKFWMTDLDKTSYSHGGGSVDYKGTGDIPEGSFSYTGPCPPSGSHDYKFDVSAINAAGDTILGKGSATKSYPPK